MSELYLLPNLLAPEGRWEEVFPQKIAKVVAQLDALIAESRKGGKRYLQRFLPRSFRDIPLHLLNEHSKPEDIQYLAREIACGGSWGLISDAGVPCLADPGADLVLQLKEKGVPVHTFTGPSAILLALLLSGLGGQAFAFHGYFPIQRKRPFLKALEQRSREERATQIFIETPYRNLQTFKDLLTILHKNTYLSCAVDITLPSEWVCTQKIAKWRATPHPDLQKRPAVFLIRA